MDHEVKDINILHFQQSLEHHEPEDYTKFYNSKMTVVDAEEPKIVNQTLQDFVQEEIIIDQVDYCGVTAAKVPKIKKVVNKERVVGLLTCKVCSYSTNKRFNLNRHIRTSLHRRNRIKIQDDANVSNIIAIQRLAPVAPAVDSEIINDVGNLSDQVIQESSISERASPITKVRSPDQPVLESVMSCLLCDFVASSAVGLRSHVRLEHPDKPRRESARIRKVILYREDEVDEYEYEKNSSSSYEDADEVNEDELTDDSTNYSSSCFVRNKRAKFYSPPRPSLVKNDVITSDLGASTNFSKLSQNEDDESCSKFVNNSNNLQSSKEFLLPISVVKNESENGEFKELNTIGAVHDTQLRELLVKNDQNLITEDANNCKKLNWQDFVRKIKKEETSVPDTVNSGTANTSKEFIGADTNDSNANSLRHHSLEDSINYPRELAADKTPELCENGLINELGRDHRNSSSSKNRETSAVGSTQEEQTTQEISDDLVHSADGGICTKDTKELVENVLYSCKICFYIAKSKSNLNKHINLEHNSAADPSCCSKELEPKMKVKRDVLFTCNICFYTTNKGCNLKRHTKSIHNIDFPKLSKETPNSKEPISTTPVTKENVQAFSCNLCTFSTNRKLNLQGHINMVHDDNISDDDGPSCRNELRNSTKNWLFTCKICFYTTKKGCNLKRHTKSMHNTQIKTTKRDGKNVSNTITSSSGPKEQPLSYCNLCNFSTKYRVAGLKRHMANVHGGPTIKIHECDLCEKKYDSKYSLKMHHMATHFLQDSPHQCQICLKKCASIWSLKKHLATRHNDSGLPEFLCSFCGKGFTQKQALTSHTTTHTGEKPYPCTECPKRFVTRQQLNQHLSSSVHRGELPYSCDTCGRKFNKIGNMQTHLKTHLNEKPFQCISCKKWFSRMDNMKNHMKRVHNLTASTAAVEQVPE